MTGCTYIFPGTGGTRLELTHYPGRKKPLIVLRETDGSYVGHAVFKDEESMAAFVELFDRILMPEEVR